MNYKKPKYKVTFSLKTNILIIYRFATDLDSLVTLNIEK
jgi:hypothetical protein